MRSKRQIKFRDTLKGDPAKYGLWVKKKETAVCLCGKDDFITFYWILWQGFKVFGSSVDSAIEGSDTLNTNQLHSRTPALLHEALWEFRLDAHNSTQAKK